MNLFFMKQSALETLKSNLPKIYPKYFTEPMNYWMEEVCGEKPFQKFEEVPNFSLTPLDKNLPLGEVDFQNCKIIYNNLKFLSETQAADERLWAGLAHENYFYDYLRVRWKMFDITKANKETARLIRSRFFFDGSARHCIINNTLARYWWVAKIFYDETKSNPFEKLDIFGAVDFTTKILYTFNSAFSSSPKIMNGIIKFFAYLKDKGLNIRDWQIPLKPAFMELNKVSGSVILDCLSEEEIAEILIEQTKKVLAKRRGDFYDSLHD